MTTDMMLKRNVFERSYGRCLKDITTVVPGVVLRGIQDRKGRLDIPMVD